MKHIWTKTAAATAVGLIALTGCSGEAKDAGAAATSAASTGGPSGAASSSDAGHMGMDHKMDGGPAPAGIATEDEPKYKVGEQVTLTADHMPGMKGATATIAGAYDTTAYSVDYTPTDGGAKVTDHKWVVQEEVKDAGDDDLEDGAAITIEADHMPGMKGAQGAVHSSTDESVYMVDYTVDGMTMKNHKWVVESEIQPAK
ncbi:DUF1541 domain-containing protein [Micrococcus porci]|uniref:YdhK family protein n=1 Tax=Micrococcus porci TaxID=2856555 RepID=UPI003CF5D97C